MSPPPFTPVWHDVPSAIAVSVGLALVFMRTGRRAAEARAFTGRFLTTWVQVLAMFVPAYAVGRAFERGAELAGRDPGWWYAAGVPVGALCWMLVWSFPAVRRWIEGEQPEDAFT